MVWRTTHGDTAVTVKYVKAYFNSSAIQRYRDFKNRCTNMKEARAVCTIPDVNMANLSDRGDGSSAPKTT